MAGIPTAAQAIAWGRKSYALIDEIGEDVMIVEATAGGPVQHGPVKMRPARYSTEELIPGGPVMLGDIRGIFNAASFPAIGRRLERKDRIRWRGRDYAVVQYDDVTRTQAGELLGIEIQLRGG